MSTSIAEIIRRSEQGVTKPFLCRAANQESWFVKGFVAAGAEALRAEWICGNLAKALHLPISDFTVANVDERLIAMSAMDGVHELGGRYAFGSKAVIGAQEITFTQATALPPEWRARVLLFDWWIRNGDRILGPIGGNPNIITTGSKTVEVWLIDHHNAFERQFDASKFWRDHIFADTRALWTPVWRRAEMKRMKAAAIKLPDVWEAMPSAWFNDNDSTSPTSTLEHDRIAEILRRPIDAPAEFWNIP